MPAGFVSKALAALSATTARWVEFADGSQAPIQGSVLIDPVTGFPLDTSGASRVVFPDNVQLGVYTAALSNDVLFTLDTTNYNSIILEVQQLNSGSLRVETSVDGVNRWTSLPGYDLDQVSNPGWNSLIVSTTKFRVPVGSRFMRVRKVGDGSTQVQVSGTQLAVPPSVVPGGSLSYTESTALLAAAATFTGTKRSNGGQQGAIGSRFKTFEAEAIASHDGTLIIEKSVDGGTVWFSVGSIAVTASTATRLSVPVFAPDYRAKYTNGSTLQTSFLLTSAYRA